MARRATRSESAVFLTREYSGSARYYARLETLRWDWIEPADLAAVIKTLDQNGLSTYALLESREEEPTFRQRFDLSALGVRLDLLKEYVGTAERVALYRCTLASNSNTHSNRDDGSAPHFVD